MKSSDSGGCLILLIVSAISIVGAVLVVKWIGESDLPFWLKFWLLK